MIPTNIRFQCRHCGFVHEVSGEYAGALASCENCAHDISIPETSTTIEHPDVLADPITGEVRSTVRLLQGPVPMEQHLTPGSRLPPPPSSPVYTSPQGYAPQQYKLPPNNSQYVPPQGPSPTPRGPVPQSPQAYPLPLQYPLASSKNSAASAGIVLGIMGLVLFWVPMIGILLAVGGIVFGAIGIGKAGKLGGSGKGKGIIGLVLGIVAVLPAFLIMIAIGVAVDEGQDGDRDRTQHEETQQQERDTDEREIGELDGPSKIEPWVYAQQLVRVRLKAPSTAKFPSGGDGSSCKVFYLGEDRYRVISYVDSQNGFGAMIRMHFEIVVMEVEGGWAVESFTKLR